MVVRIDVAEIFWCQQNPTDNPCWVSPNGIRVIGYNLISSDRSSCTDDGLLYIYLSAAATFSDLEHLCLSILLQVSL